MELGLKRLNLDAYCLVRGLELNARSSGFNDGYVAGYETILGIGSE